MAVIIDKIGLQWRRVQLPDHPNAIALQSVDIERPRTAESPRQIRIGRIEQRLAGRPEKTAAGSADQHAHGIVVVADRNTAIGVAEIKRNTNGVFVGLRLPDARRSLVGVDDRVAHDTAGTLLRHRAEIIGADRSRSLSEEHAALFVKSNLGNFSRNCGGRYFKFDGGVVAERAVGIQCDRPDVQTGGDGVIEPARADTESEDATLERSVIPGG